MFTTIGDCVRQLMLPAPHVDVLPGVRWGRFDELFTAAYWRGQAWQHEHLGTYKNLRLGSTLSEETAACLLGGYGMRAELGLHAFRRLRDQGLLSGTPTASVLEVALATPFLINARRLSYRFPRQKARYLAECLDRLGHLDEGVTDDLKLRDFLLALPGIGPKTASWIVRNHRSSNAVAIIDVHILRAGKMLGIFRAEATPEKNYDELEAGFLRFANAIKTAPALLDGLIWDYMRSLRGCLSEHFVGSQAAVEAAI